MSKVGFLVCGTQKGGTTALYELLNKHEHIGMAKVKEVHYFDKENNFTASPNYEKYHEKFDFTKNQTIYGEVTPIYMYWNNAPKRIYDYNNNMKIVILLRNPIERAYSQWNMQVQKAKENLNFFDAISNEKLRSFESVLLQHRVYSYIDRGFYLTQIKRMWHYFGKDNVLILKSEDLQLYQNNVLNKIAAFLEVSPFDNISSLNAHSREYKEMINEKSYNFLYNTYFHEIKNIEKALDWDCSKWLKKYHAYIKR